MKITNLAMFVLVLICVVVTGIFTIASIQGERPGAAALLAFWTGFNLRNALVYVQFT